jgi:uncharacterized glyoxalase superfamily protein PhnB
VIRPLQTNLAGSAPDTTRPWFSLSLSADTVREMVVRSKTASAGARLVIGVRYRNVAAASDWLCAAFGFEKHHIGTSEDGEILYAHLTLGNDMIMVRSVRDSHLDQLMKQPDEIGGAETRSCYFVVDDADAHYRSAKAAGAGIVLDISDDDHGGRGYSCRDPEGHLWSFGTYDPWQRRSRAARVAKLYRPAIAAALLVGMIAAGTAGWMLPRPAPAEDEPRAKVDAVADHERAEQEAARAKLLVVELARERSAKDAAERTAHAAREQLAREQGANKAAEISARQLEGRVAEERRAKEFAERTAKAESEQVARERAAREAEQRVASDTMKELTREREAKQRAERQAQDALEQLASERQLVASERRAKEDAERSAREARERLAEAQKAETAAVQPAKEPPARKSSERKASAQIWDCRPRGPDGQVICHPVGRGKR